MPTASTKPQTKAVAVDSAPAPKCTVTEFADGAMVAFQIDPQDWARLKRRMGTQDPARFMWENHLYRMIMGAVY